MSKILQLFGFGMLVAACILLTLCISHYLCLTSEADYSDNSSISEEFIPKKYKELNQAVLSPLVQQAQAYALCLNPPKPKNEDNFVNNSLVRAVSTVPKVHVTAKFKLVATSYCRSKPEESYALIAEPGSEEHWVKIGTRLGHFTVEKIERNLIVYNDGKQSLEMVIDKTFPLDTQGTAPTMVASNEVDTIQVKSSNIRRVEAGNNKDLEVNVSKRQIPTSQKVERKVIIPNNNLSSTADIQVPSQGSSISNINNSPIRETIQTNMTNSQEIKYTVFDKRKNRK